MAGFKPRISIVTLGVKNLEKSLAFYRDVLGLKTKGIVGTEFIGDETQPNGAIAMFNLENDLILALYPRTELAKDSKLHIGKPSSTEFSIGYFAESKENVDEILGSVYKAGGKVTDKPHSRPWGIYSGYFQDLDGHLWEIIWNPRA